jgi:predicted secreted protein
MITPFSGFVLYAFIWFLTFLAVLPVRLSSQADTGEVTPGTPESAPANPQMRLRLIVTTGIATLVFGLIVWTILSGVITIENMDIYNRWLNG